MTKVRSQTPTRAPSSTSQTGQTARKAPEKEGSRVHVKQGDNLQKLAQKHLGDASRWPELAQANPQISDPSKLRVGDEILIPARATRGLTDQTLQSRTGLGETGQSSANFASSHANQSTALPQKNGTLNLLSAVQKSPSGSGSQGTSGHSVDQLTSKDASVRGPALEAATQAAAQGDPGALQALAGVLNKGDDLYDLDYSDRKAVLSQAAGALVGAEKHLGSAEYQALAKALDSFDTREVVAPLLERGAKAGQPEVLDALRHSARGRYSVNREAADVLAGAGKHLTAGDYQLLAQAGLDSVGRSPSRDAISQGVKAGNADALGVLQDTLAQTKGNYGLTNRQQAAAEILAEHPAQIRSADLPHLERLATQASDSWDQESGFKAIAAAAAKTPPVAGAAKAFARSMQAAEKAASDDDGKRTHNYLWNVSQRQAPKAFAAAQGDPEARAALAPYALDAARDARTGNAAVETLAPLAAQGDKPAMAALAKASGQSFIMPHETRDQAHAALQDAAAKGKAGEVCDTLMAEFKRAGASDDGRVLEGLGQAARHLPADDPRMPKVRSALRKGLGNGLGSDKKGHASAAKGLQAIADRLESKDLDALKQNLSPEAGEALAQAAKHLPDDQRGALHADLRDRVSSNMYNDRGAAAALAADAEKATPADVEALSREARTLGGFESDRTQARGALAEVLEKSTDPATQRAAANALLDLPASQLDGKVRQELVDHAATSKDVKLKQRVLDKLPTSPITDRHLQDVAKTYGRLVQDKIKNAPDGSDWQQLGKLMTAKQMAKDPKYKDNVNTAKLDQKINALCNGKLKDGLAEVRQNAIRRATPHDLGQKQADYLKSDAFQQRLQLQSRDQQRRSIQSELGKLQGVAPAKVREAADHIAGRAMQDNAVRGLQSFKSDPDRQTAALSEALSSISGGAKTSAGVTKKLVGVINSIHPDTPSSKVASRMIEGLAEAQKAARRADDLQGAAEAGKAITLLKKLNSRGQLSGVLAGASVLGLATQGVPKNGEEWAKTASTVLNVAGDASDLGKIFRVAEAGKLGKALKFMDWLGPAGDLVGAGVDAYGSWKDFKQGDNFGGSMKAVGAASGVTGAIAGVAILAGATGPAAPVVLLGATVVGLAAWGLDAAFGKSDEQSFLENIGVWQED